MYFKDKAEYLTVMGFCHIDIVNDIVGHYAYKHVIMISPV